MLGLKRGPGEQRGRPLRGSLRARRAWLLRRVAQARGSPRPHGTQFTTSQSREAVIREKDTFWSQRLAKLHVSAQLRVVSLRVH